MNKRFIIILLTVGIAVFASIIFILIDNDSVDNNKASNGDIVCAAVITKAKNNLTGVVQDFPNACLPEGWTPVP